MATAILVEIAPNKAKPAKAATSSFGSKLKSRTILPANKPQVAEFVEIVARDFEDTVLRIPELSKDGVHPTYKGYKNLANSTR